MKSRMTKTAWAFYAEQLDWFNTHGGSLAAYVERYGSKDDPRHYGSGGEAIYAADKAALDKAQTAYNKLHFETSAKPKGKTR